MGKRFEVTHTDDLMDMVPIPTTHTVTIRDKETGEKVKGHGTTVKGAEKNAWDKMGKSKK